MSRNENEPTPEEAGIETQARMSAPEPPQSVANAEAPTEQLGTAPTERIGTPPSDAAGPSPWMPDAAAPASGPSPTAAADPSHPRRLPARFSTILWGLIVIAIAVAVGALRTMTAVIDPVLLVTGGLVAGGLALLVVGIAAAARRAG